MTTIAHPGMSRRAFTLGVLGLGAYALLKAFSVAGLGEVTVEMGEHSKLQHGLGAVLAVRQAMAAKAQAAPQWFNRPPCQDGRWRFLLALDATHWAIWVLEAAATPGVLYEVTAFVTSKKKYIKAVQDKCKGGSGGATA